MSEILNRFDICSNISKNLRKQIKLFHVFSDQKGYNVLFITSDDKVFGFGSNAFGCCGLGHNTDVKTPQFIPELCHKNINQFFIGWSFTLAIDIEQQLYGWGRNDWGQLGRSSFSLSLEVLKPEIISLEEKVIQVSCGSQHSLALTSEGNVYGWGYNRYGQIGCGRGPRITKPIRLCAFDKRTIKLVYCCFSSTFALTHEGQVYSWGDKYRCSLGHELKRDEVVFAPKLVNITNVMSVCSSNTNTYFLTKDGDIYFCGVFKDDNNSQICHSSPSLLKIDTKIIYLHSITHYRTNYSIATGVTQNNIFKFNSNHMEKCLNKSLFDYYGKKWEITYKTLSINMRDSQYNFDSEYTQADKMTFHTSFETFEELGCGGFGVVYKARKRYTNEVFAIKKILIQDDNEFNKDFLREVNTLSQCSGDYVVQYFDSWIENNNCLYIQMELCSDNLKNVIQQKPKFFRRSPTKAMNITEYFISSQIFKELLECVKYLHESNPPIMHRDLKPANILVKDNSVNGRFLKLCDFGLAKLDSLNTRSHTSSQGTPRYMAPELTNAKESSNKYNRKVDIFSLGLILEDLFDFDTNDPDLIIDNDYLREKFNNLGLIFCSMTSPIYKKRPTCAEILAILDQWSIEQDKFNRFVLGDEQIIEYEKECSSFLYSYLLFHI